MQPSPPTSPSSTTWGEPRQAPRRRWPRPASGLASPMSRAQPGNAPPGFSPATVGPRRPRGRGPTRGFGAADLAAVLATCHRPRRRGRPGRPRARPSRRRSARSGWAEADAASAPLSTRLRVPRAGSGVLPGVDWRPRGSSRRRTTVEMAAIERSAERARRSATFFAPS